MDNRINSSVRLQQNARFSVYHRGRLPVAPTRGQLDFNG